MLTLKANEIVEEIVKGVLEHIGSLGFSYVKSQYSFIKKNEKSNFRFGIYCTKWPSYCSISIYVCLLNKKVEESYKKIFPHEHNTKCTVGKDLRNLMWDKEIKDWTIYLKDDDDIKNAVNTIKGYFFDIALPFFEAYNDIKTIERAYNEKVGKSSSAVGGGYDDQCYKGLILAKLVGRKDLDDIIDNYKIFIQKIVKKHFPDVVKKFEYLKENLDNIIGLY